MVSKFQKTRILIVDDHEMVSEGLALRISLHDDLEVCGRAAGEDEALALIKERQPDLMLVDMTLRSGHGLDLIKRARVLRPRLKMLVVSGFDESLYAERAMRAGALGYLNKQESHERLIEAIRTVLAGERFVSPEITRRLVDRALGGLEEEQSPVERLSDRELEVFRMIGEGLTSGVIANRLMLSTHTIDTHRENIKRKLGVRTAAELSRAAVEWVLANS